MDWLQVLSLFLANAGLLIWFRQESRIDWRHMDSKLDTYMRDSYNERVDFHNNICKIQERHEKKD